MEQHYQVINLHSIIRSQQAKIQQLRQQLRIASEREESRYGQFVQNNKVSLDQKDKMIEYLKSELDKIQKNMTVGITDASDRFDKQRQKLQKQVIAQKRKCLQLEAKLKRAENQYESHLQVLTEENKKYIEEIRKYNESKTALTIQVTKLNHFYKNSLFQIGKRKETLLWVDKFTQYLESSQAKEKRTLEDVSNFVKNEVNSLKTSLAEMVGEINNNQVDVHVHKGNSTTELTKIAYKIKQECEKVLQQNDHFWNNVVKQQKQSQKQEEIKNLTYELQKSKQKHQLDMEQLKNKLKASQSEKKTIILGFQELRSLIEQKQNNYREEIKHLKKNIQDLIESGTERDKEFQRQIKTLTSQIQNISERYYENIENPARRASMKVTEDMQQVRLQLSKIQSSEEIRKSVEKLERLIDHHFPNSQNRGQRQLEDYLQTSNHILEELLQVAHQGNQGREGSTSKTYTSRGNTFQRQVDQINEEEQIVLKEKFNKSQYEAVLAKKHLSKLKEYCENLQKKNNSGSSTKKGEKQMAIAQKVMQLEAQNEALKQSIDLLKQNHRHQKEQLVRKAHLKSSSEQFQISSASALRQSVIKMNEMNRKVEDHLQKQARSLNEMKENIKLLRMLLIKPLQSLQLINSHITQVGKADGIQIKINSYIHSQIRAETDRIQVGGVTQRSYHSIFAGSDQVKQYKQLILKRNQINSNTSKLISDLIRVLRQAYAKEKQKPVKKQEEIIHKRPELRLKNVEKRIRQLQTTKLKSHCELVGQLAKLQQNQQKLNTKINKATSLKSTLNKFETNLDSKINQIVSKTQIKLDRSEIVALKDDVISDLRAKLQESVYQSQGLRKQMNIVMAQKRM